MHLRSPTRARSLPAALLLLAVVLTACRGASAPDPARPPVVVIVLDTLRADRLGCYGHTRPTSPRIDALAAGGTLYTRCYASSPWTLPSHASLFTGLLPHEHGAQTVLVDGEAREQPLDDRVTTLAEALADEGYATGAFVANAAMLGPSLGICQGFTDHFVRAVPGAELLPPIRRWLRARRGEPFLLFVNLMDTHSPYNAAPRRDVVDPPPPDDGGALLKGLYEPILGGDGPLPAAELATVIDQYDTAVAHADEAVGGLLDALDRRGQLDGALVVVTSDHGEYFGEHRLIEHSKDLYQPALHVPLVIKAPGQRDGAVADDIVTSATTLHRMLDALPAELGDRLRARFPAPDPPLLVANRYTRARDLADPRWGERFRRERTALFDDDHKYIRSSDGAHELYDLATDPGELHDLTLRDPERAARLAAQLDAALAAHPAAPAPSAPPPRLTPEEIAALRVLGYVE